MTKNKKANKHHKKQMASSELESEKEGESIIKQGTTVPGYLDLFVGDSEQEGEKKDPELDTSKEEVLNLGNIAMLADPQLSDVMIEQPYSEKKSKELQLVNEFLARMNKQVLAYWVNPYKGQHMYKGVVKVELDEYGYLEDAFVYIASGHPALDKSVISAVLSVTRFKVPENKIITNRYYRQLRFHYSSLDDQTELMPFEVESEKATKKEIKEK